MKDKRNKSLFWRIYIAATAGFLVLIIAFFLFFYDYIGAYEISQPDVFAKQFAETLTDSEWENLFKQSITGEIVFESEDVIAEAYCRAFREMQGEYAVQQDFSYSGEEGTRFFLLKGDASVATLTLHSTSGGKYGFPMWSVSEIQSIHENLMEAPLPFYIIVPRGSEVSVNGILLDDSYITDQNTSYPFASEFEIGRTADCITYTVHSLYTKPSVRCIWQNNDCTVETADNRATALYPDSCAASYTVTAPSDAVISVNGVVVSDKYITDKHTPYAVSIWEKDGSTIPTECVYTIPGLLNIPEITAVMDNVVLEVFEQGTDVHVSYPESMYYTATFTVPAGCEVIVNGQPLGDAEMVSTISAYPELFESRADAPALCVYALERLFAPVSNVTFIFEGQEIEANVVPSGREVAYTVEYPSVSMPSVEEFALDFCKDYFYYTSSGYNNTDRNLAQVLSYMIPNSSIYTRVKKSKIGIDYVTPVTSHKYHEIFAERTIIVDADTAICCIYYDIEQWTYNTQRIYDGHLWILMDKNGDSWMVSGMLTDIK